MPRKRKGGPLGRLTPHAKRKKGFVPSQTSDSQTSDSQTSVPQTSDTLTSDPQTSDPETSDPQTSDPNNKSLPQILENDKNNDKLQFKCTICTKVYATKSNLKRHLKTHTAVKVHSNTIFKCDKCDQTFTRKDNFERHLKSHNDVAKLIYNCTYCIQKKF